MNKEELLRELEKSRPDLSKYVHRRMRWRWPLYQLQRRIQRFFAWLSGTLSALNGVWQCPEFTVTIAEFKRLFKSTEREALDQIRVRPDVSQAKNRIPGSTMRKTRPAERLTGITSGETNPEKNPQ